MDSTLLELLKIMKEEKDWLDYLCGIGPMVLTAITMLIACRQHRENKKLQQYIALQNDTSIIREAAIDIYHVYFNGLSIANSMDTDEKVANVFSSQVSYLNMYNKILECFNSISFRKNKTSLIFKELDDDFVKINHEAFMLFEELKIAYCEYAISENPYEVIKKALKAVALKYKINEMNELNALYLLNHDNVKKDYISECENIYTKNIAEKAQKYINYLKQPNFDNKFAEYVRIDNKNKLIKNANEY